jgi:hypothetical protein
MLRIFHHVTVLHVFVEMQLQMALNRKTPLAMNLFLPTAKSCLLFPKRSEDRERKRLGKEGS